MTAGWWLVALGTPAPQGSKTPAGMFANGKQRMVESSKAVGPWRDRVSTAAYQARQDGAPQLLDGPLEVLMVFTIARPASAKRTDFAPWKMPDLSKYVRATEDAIKESQLWHDDGQVQDLRALKVWAGYSRLALAATGVRVICSPAVDDRLADWAELPHIDLLEQCLAAHPAPDLEPIYLGRQQKPAAAPQGALL